MHSQALRVAMEALPNEVCGLFYQPVGETGVHLRTFTGYASPTSCSANPDELIAFAYDMQVSDSHVVATFHTHPQGQESFSPRDAQLALWSHLHLLFVLQARGDWQAAWGTG